MSDSWFKLSRQQAALQRAARARLIELETRLMNAGFRRTADPETQSARWTCPRTAGVYEQEQALELALSLPTTKATRAAHRRFARSRYGSNLRNRFPRSVGAQPR